MTAYILITHAIQVFYHMLLCALISEGQACSSLVQNRRCGIVSLKSWSKCPTTSIMRRHSGRMKCIKHQQFCAAQNQTSYYSLKLHAINDNRPLFLLLPEVCHVLSTHCRCHLILRCFPLLLRRLCCYTDTAGCLVPKSSDT